MRRGEIRRYTRPSSPDIRRAVVLLSSDGINDSPRPWLLGIELRAQDPAELPMLVHAVVVDQVAALLGVAPSDLDPRA